MQSRRLTAHMNTNSIDRTQIPLARTATCDPLLSLNSVPSVHLLFSRAAALVYAEIWFWTSTFLALPFPDVCFLSVKVVFKRNPNGFAIHKQDAKMFRNGSHSHPVDTKALLNSPVVAHFLDILWIQHSFSKTRDCADWCSCLLFFWIRGLVVCTVR